VDFLGLGPNLAKSKCSPWMWLWMEWSGLGKHSFNHLKKRFQNSSDKTRIFSE